MSEKTTAFSAKMTAASGLLTGKNRSRLGRGLCLGLLCLYCLCLVACAGQPIEVQPKGEIRVGVGAGQGLR